jgi:hypothetical protein
MMSHNIIFLLNRIFHAGANHMFEYVNPPNHGLVGPNLLYSFLSLLASCMTSCTPAGQIQVLGVGRSMLAALSGTTLVLRHIVRHVDKLLLSSLPYFLLHGLCCVHQPGLCCLMAMTDSLLSSWVVLVKEENTSLLL